MRQSHKKKTKKNDLSTMENNEIEFDGLISFEEIKSYKVLSESYSGKRKRFKCMSIGNVKQDDIIMKEKNDTSKQSNFSEDNNIQRKTNSSSKIKKKRRITEENMLNEDSSIHRKINSSSKIKNRRITEENMLSEDSSIHRKINSSSKIKKRRITEENMLSETMNVEQCIGDSQISMKEWESIFVPRPIIKALTRLGFKKPTEIQRLTIPAAIKDHRNIVGAAETGSGKTLAFGIPIISGILKKRKEQMEIGDDYDVKSEFDISQNINVNPFDPQIETLGSDYLDQKGFENMSNKQQNSDTHLSMDNEPADIQDVFQHMEEESTTVDFLKTARVKNYTQKNPPNKLRGLIITPTRELAVQIKQHLDKIVTEDNISIALVIGGMSYEKQRRILNNGPDIVVGTPGRLWELIQDGDSFLSEISNIDYLAIDETDRMLEKGHFDELKHILEELTCDDRQNFIFSATLTMTHKIEKKINRDDRRVKQDPKDAKLKDIYKMVGMKGKPKVVDITRSFGTVETLSEARIYCERDEKDAYLYYFLTSYPSRTLVFCNSIDCVRRLTNLLTILECKPLSLHAMKHQKQRLKSLERFAETPESVMLATDVAARGLDIPGIDHILHYEVPRTVETYIHRSGRTARAFEEGLSVIIVEPTDMVKFRQLQTSLNRTHDLPPFPTNLEMLAQVRKRVSLARKIETAQFRARKKASDGNWLKKMSEEAGIELEDDLSDDGRSNLSMESRKLTEQTNAYKKQLRTLLARPLIHKGNSLRYPTTSGKLVNPTAELMEPRSAISVVKREKVDHMLRLKKMKPAKQIKHEKKTKQNKKQKKSRRP